ncbi:MAG: sulfate transporter [Methanobacteriota archaeon]|nr:MAG: sulfate transporter [Euryarchaeota archaeon]
MTTRLKWMTVAVGTAVVVSTLAVWFLWLAPRPRVLIVGSTTTTQDTGLLDVLQVEYTGQTGMPVRIVVAGTGAILQQGRDGDLDVLLTHDRARELTFVADQQGLWRKPVMYNWFVLVGPGVRTWNSSLSAAQLAQNASAFLALLYEHRTEITFVSRGDGSGTYAKELALWASAGVDASLLSGSWYKETGSGQANTLRVAAEFGGYALTDEATWNLLQAQGLTGNLTVVVRDLVQMKNLYAVIPINAAVHPKAYEEGALAFAAWLTGAAGQAVVENFQVAGKPAFYPDAGDPNA